MHSSRANQGTAFVVCSDTVAAVRRGPCDHQADYGFCRQVVNLQLVEDTIFAGDSDLQPGNFAHDLNVRTRSLGADNLYADWLNTEGLHLFEDHRLFQTQRKVPDLPVRMPVKVVDAHCWRSEVKRGDEGNSISVLLVLKPEGSGFFLAGGFGRIFRQRLQGVHEKGGR